MRINRANWCEILNVKRGEGADRLEGGLNVSLTAAKKKLRSLQDLVGLADGSMVHPDVKDA